MKDILQEIVAAKRIEVEQAKHIDNVAALKAAASWRTTRRSLRRSLEQSASGVIAEFKRRSPSKGWIHPGIDPTSVAPLYELGGASAMSVLTDEPFFGGTLCDLKRVRPLVNMPLLRKDFVIDPHQLLQAAAAGADAVLLIAACLTTAECGELSRCAADLGLEVLLEIHSESELDYITPEIALVGVNNRNLGTFHTDVENSFRLASQLPSDRVLVAESGISSPATVKRLRQAGFRGFLIGENFMKEDDPGAALARFIKELEQ